MKIQLSGTQTDEPKIDRAVDEKSENIAAETKETARKSKRGRWSAGLIVAVLIAAVVLFAFFASTSENRRIHSLIESESYALAFKEICLLNGEGHGVDKLLKTYIAACMEDGEYKRVAKALPLFSRTAYNDVDYFVGLYAELSYSNEEQAQVACEYLYGQEVLRAGLEAWAKQN